MSLPNLPPFYDMPYTTEGGRLTAESFLYNDNMFQTLNLVVVLLNNLITSSVSSNNTIVNQGVVFPSYTTAEITALEPDAQNGTVWFNTTLSKLQVKTATGTIETIQSV